MSSLGTKMDVFDSAMRMLKGRSVVILSPRGRIITHGNQSELKKYLYSLEKLKADQLNISWEKGEDFTQHYSHTQAECTSKDCGGGCYACTVSICSVCGGLEASLTTQCSGKMGDMETDAKVYSEGLDYTAEKGWYSLNMSDFDIMSNRHPQFKERKY